MEKILSKLTNLSDLNYKNYPPKVRSKILEIRDAYQNNHKYIFGKSPEDQIAYFLFWWPRQIAILQEFLHLSQLVLEEPIFDWGCGGAPGLFLYPDKKWIFYDQDTQLLKNLSQALNVPVAIQSPENIGKSIHPRTLLFQMSFFEIKPSLNLIENFLQNDCTIVIIEPGDLLHFQNLAPLRKKFSEFIQFPCPQGIKSCPMDIPESKNWCHARRSWEAPGWYTSLSQHLAVDTRFLKFTGLVLSKKKLNFTTQRVVSIPKKIGSKKAKILEYDTCTASALIKLKLKAEKPHWPWDSIR